MRAADTNVILRLIVGDDPDQEAVARAMLEREPLFVTLSVVMECEWVLRSFYKRKRLEIVTALDRMTDVDGIFFEQVDGVRWALGRLAAGADFADMIHIVQARATGATGFVTFDESIAEDVGIAAPSPVQTLA